MSANLIRQKVIEQITEILRDLVDDILNRDTIKPPDNYLSQTAKTILSIEELGLELCKTQAQISFLLGKTAGIREVVEWIQPYINILPLPSVHRWQAQLKEWGIE